MKNLMRVVPVLFVTMLLIACASGTEKTLLSVEESLVIKGYTVVGPVNSVSNYRINGWSYVNDKHIIVNAGVRDHYLVSFRNSCREADSAIELGFTNTAGRLTTADKMIVKAPGGFSDQCYIRSITRLERAKKPAASG